MKLKPELWLIKKFQIKKLKTQQYCVKYILQACNKSELYNRLNTILLYFYKEDNVKQYPETLRERERETETHKSSTFSQKYSPIFYHPKSQNEEMASPIISIKNS